MPLALTPLRRLVIVLLVTTAAATHAAAQDQIQTPALARAWPDRADVGDTVTLVGTQLDEGGTTLAVTLGTTLTCPVTRRTDTAVDITVPAGARSGYAAVTVTKQLPDGTSVSATSNSVPLLVVWAFFDTTGLGPYESYGTPYNLVVPSPADSIDVCFGGWDFFGRVETDLYSVRHDRSIAMVGRNSQDWLNGSRVAIDPLSGEVVAAVTVSRYGSFTQYLKNLSTGATLFQFPYDPHGATLMPMAVRFDSSGVLYVAVCDQDGLTRIFHFRPGDTITFDFKPPGCMIPSGVALQGFCFDGGDMAVAGDGTVEYIPCSLVDPGKRSDVLRAPGPNGALFETSQLPDFGYTDGTFWYLAARCNGQALAAGSSWGGNSPVSVISLTDGSVVTTLSGVTRLDGFGTDGYDNLFVHGLFPAGSRYRWGLRRLTVADLPSGFYGTPPPGVAVATQHASALFEAPADPATIPPEWLVKRRERPNAALMRTLGERSARPVPGVAGTVPNQPVTAAVAAADIAIRARTVAVSQLDVPPGMFCMRGGQLQVEIDGKPYGDGANVTIPLGKELDLTAWWYQGPDPSDKVSVNVQWKLDGAKPEWDEEHAAAAAAGLVESQAASETAVLFPDDVLLLFDEGSPDAAIRDRRVWPIHTGTVNLKLHADQTPEGQPADIQVQVEVTYQQEHLGQAWNYYDPTILQWANAFGFPPQYIKGLIQKESSFNEQQYRYEPLGWDYGDLLETGILFSVRSDPYYLDYRFAEPAGVPLLNSGAAPQGVALVQDDIDGRLHASYPYWITAAKYAPCQQVVSGMGGVSTWQLLLGSNAYTLCHEASWNWEPSSDMYLWDPNRTDNQKGSALDSTYWFFNHPEATAQTFLAASYGLTQVGYAAALKGMHWWEGMPERRHWANVIDPNTNIYLGARWLVWPARPPGIPDLLSQASHYEAQFTGLLGQFLCTYNKGGGLKGLRPAACGYDALVGGYATDFGPTLEGQ